MVHTVHMVHMIASIKLSPLSSVDHPKMETVDVKPVEDHKVPINKGKNYKKTRSHCSFCCSCSNFGWLRSFLA